MRNDNVQLLLPTDTTTYYIIIGFSSIFYDDMSFILFFGFVFILQRHRAKEMRFLSAIHIEKFHRVTLKKRTETN